MQKTVNAIERFLPSALVSLAFAVTCAYLYFGAPALFRDPDTPWHLAIGDLLLAQGALPATDPWSFASGGQPWYIISWMWDIVLALVHRAFDLQGVFMFTVMLISAVIALMAYSLMQRERVGTDALILTLFLAAFGFVEFSSARPHVIGYICILVTHLLLHRSRASDGKGLWLLPLLMVLWVNNHGSFLAGFTLLGAYGLEALITRRFAWFKRLFVIGLLCLPALLVNPYGIHMYDAVMRTLDSVVTQYLYEWMPFVFSNSLGISAWFLVFVLMGSVREPSVPIADKIISVLWLLAMLFSMRSAAIFILVSAPMMAISLQRFVEQMASIRTVRPDVGLALQRPGMRLRMALLAIMLSIAGSFMVGGLRGEAAIMPEKDSGAAIAWLKEHAAGKRVLNSYDYGGRLIFETQGSVPVFADGRAGTAYSEEVLAEAITFAQLQKGWETIAVKYRADYMLVDSASRFAEAYADGQYRNAWKEAYRDKVAAIYKRRP